MCGVWPGAQRQLRWGRRAVPAAAAAAAALFRTTVPRRGERGHSQSRAAVSFLLTKTDRTSLLLHPPLPPPPLPSYGAAANKIISKFYGCGTPIPTSIQGLDILDLGSGSGRDCYLAAALVGEGGSVTGIDMTEEQLEVARAHVDTFRTSLGPNAPPMRFVKGMIEFIEDGERVRTSLDLRRPHASRWRTPLSLRLASCALLFQPASSRTQSTSQFRIA